MVYSLKTAATQFYKAFKILAMCSILMFFFVQQAQAQKDEKILEANCIVEDENGVKVPDVTAVVTREPGAAIVEKQTTNKKGSLTFFLPLNREFIITFSKQGYVTKKISVNTKVVNTKEVYFQYPYTLILSKNIGKNYGPEILGKPIVKVYYEQANKEFDFDSLYSAAIKRELASLTADQKQKLIEKLELKKNVVNDPVKSKQLDKEFSDLVNQVAVQNNFSSAKPTTPSAVPANKPLTPAQQLQAKKEQEERDRKEKERIEKERIEKERLEKERIEKERKEKEEHEKMVALEIQKKKQMAKEMEEQLKKMKEQEKLKAQQDSIAKANTKKEEPVAAAGSNSPKEVLSKEIMIINKTRDEMIGLESMMLIHNQSYVSYLEKVKEKNDNYETKYNTKNPLTSLLDAMEEIDKARKRALRQNKK